MSDSANKPQILDACCGSRMFWFDKEHENALYMDNRTLETTLCDGRKLVVNPDIVADFKNIPFDNETFYLVIFDPPHLLHAGDTSYLKAKYGTLGLHGKMILNRGSQSVGECLKKTEHLFLNGMRSKYYFPM